ncbi:MAG: hypothetical protein SVW77_00060 [Candidatus Nanohaloarchaea archaeon]|nr:hypothetical protein [Candidatus Nanohaloarchaea archaeon]
MDRISALRNVEDALSAFEAGECTLADLERQVRGVLQTVAKQLGTDLAVEERDHGSFHDKRCGTVLIDGEAAGVVGEVSDEVRENWDVDVPVAAFEVDIGTLRAAAT